MIDQDKMRALAAELRKYTGRTHIVSDATAAADAIDLLLEELEAAAADKRDAERYRFMRTKAVYEGSSDWTIEIWGRFASFEEALDAQIALAQRQGEES
ncbi:hypothetical protein WT15_27265 [Burkholderia stagnalis]|uniref:hypothetical protein n=1 Tax=Burkholderia stagnalis TaxID=1503054 RepID=UPI0007521A49|nr:hypothetical protein [Burkholderia stagnalis]KVN72779.1 hypothetical protein WT15_27265 [Burkholderia stagnalis]KWO38159.1 hypothetical protein WT96_12630 [Burkholderia stagnalis]KWO44448.1 hypothetical protein WT95_29495 [Burkholderia stagnalis]